MRVLLVALGGALGSVARYGLSGFVHRYAPPSFPYGTFVVNVAGCLAFGLIAGLVEARSVISPAARTFLLIGVLGGFTTFSSYAFETFALLRDVEIGRALVNAAGQVVVGLLVLWLGYVLARAI
jgi:fluoride exporter